MKSIRKWLSQIPAESIIALAGVLLIGVGTWMLSPAWSLIVVGSLFCLDSIVVRRK